MKREKLTQIVTFRLDYEQWAQLESAARGARAKPNDWVRDLTIETLCHRFDLKQNERILFEQFARTQYLVANGFQLLADDKLTSEEWKKFRAFAKEKIDVITDRALAEFQSKSGGEEPDSSGRPLRMNP